MFPIEAESPDKLLGILRETEVPVDRKGLGQTKDQTEPWLMRDFLLAVSRSGPLEFPVTIEHRGKIEQDGPDFVLSHRSGRIGIDLTEAVCPNQAKIEAYENKNRIEPAGRLITIGSPDEKTLKKKDCEERDRGAEMLELRRSEPKIAAMSECEAYRYLADRFGLKTPDDAKKAVERARALVNPKPSMGDEWERLWLKSMEWFIDKKSRKLEERRLRHSDRSPDGSYQDLIGNWLLIHDNLDGLRTICATECASMLRDWLSGPERKVPFERIFIRKGKAVLGFDISRGDSMIYDVESDRAPMTG